MTLDVPALLRQLNEVPSEDLESETLEFKGYESETSLHNAKDLAEEISALANTLGGDIIVGVRDSSNVPFGQWPRQLQGFKSVDLLKTKERIAGRLTPSIDIAVRSVIHDRKTYLVIKVPQRRDTLVSTTSGKVMIRIGRSSRPMTPDEITSAVKALQSYDWSAEDIEEASTDLLDPASLQAAQADFAQRRQIPLPGDEAFLEAIGASKNGYLTKGGLLFLGRESAVRRHLGDFEFRFTWRSKNGELQKNDIWSSNLWQAIQRAQRHFDTCNWEGNISFRGKTYKVPLLDSVAFHEAYLNALVHRDYAVDGMVAVSFDSNNLRITSPGTFYGGVTAENITQHQPRHRNKALANILMQFNLVDRAGQGIIRMSKNSLRYGRELPRFREMNDSVEVTLQGEFIRPGIFVLVQTDPEIFGIPALIVANTLWRQGYSAVESVEAELRRVVPDPWESLKLVVDSLPYFDLVGTNDGVFVRFATNHRIFAETNRTLALSSKSAKHVAIHEYLKRYGEISNAEATQLLGYKHSSTTSVFFRESAYLKQRGGGSTAKWYLARDE